MTMDNQLFEGIYLLSKIGDSSNRHVSFQGVHMNPNFDDPFKTKTQQARVHHTH